MSALLAEVAPSRVARFDATPVWGIDTFSNRAVKTGVWPIFHLRHEPMFGRVVVCVIHMGVVIADIANPVLPEPGLPQAAVATWTGCVRQIRVSGEARLDEAPASGKILVASRQRPDGMHMVGQDHPGIDVERHPSKYRGYALAQDGRRVFIRQKTASLRSDHGEEPGGAVDPGSSIVRHVHEANRPACGGNVGARPWMLSGVAAKVGGRCPPYTAIL